MMELSNVSKKKKPLNVTKNKIIFDIGTAQCDDGTIKYEKKKIRVPSNVTKVRSEVMLVLHNVRIESSNVKKTKEPPNVTKELSHMILELNNVRMKLSNVRKKK